MFTGIVTHQLSVAAVTPGPRFVRLVIPRPQEFDDLAHGDSVAVNGVCLTVAELDAAVMHFDVIAETLAKTNLGMLGRGDAVHLERAMRAGDRFDGHFVQGHVDGTAPIVSSVASESEWRVAIEAPDSLARYLIPKGSVCLDGVSLTIAAVEGKRFEVALIPTTVSITTLARRPVGYLLNLECDMMVKTIVSVMERVRAR